MRDKFASVVCRVCGIIICRPPPCPTDYIQRSYQVPTHKALHIAQALGRHMLNLSKFNELCGCCPQQCGTGVGLQKLTFCSSIIWGCFSTGPPRLTTEANVTQLQHFQNQCPAIRGVLINSRKFPLC